MIHLKSFIAGFVATLVFHQGLVAILHAVGLVPFAAWNMVATEPLGVPAVISLAFWGGIWGIVLWLLIRRSRGTRRWLLALAIGAIGPTAVALLVVFPLKGISVSLAMVPFGLILNGTWGVGTLLLLVAMRRAGWR
ncbi:MAG: hypothetical protein U5K33_10120 [Halofilum sp. (in: g-proteobacteria)]|nr:hypothetical protein [Halofilum sp. (in: g-proteobacteria)]